MNRLLQRRIVEVIWSTGLLAWGHGRARRGEEVPPREAGRGVGARSEGVREVHLAESGGEVGGVAAANEPELRDEPFAARVEQRRAVVRPLAATDHELMALQVDRPSIAARGPQPKARAVEELAEESEGRLQPIEEREHLATGDHVGEVVRATRRALQAFERGHLDPRRDL
ncbi:MAG: hypothetical protein R3A48_19900 [Polyangiales bacterium]